MAMQALRDGAKGGVLKFFLLGILCLAGGGLVFTDVGGFFRGGVSASDVVKIGRETVSINSFDRVARRTLAQLGISPQQAYKLGYMDQILTSEINRRTLMRAANESDLSVGKEYVVEQMQSILAPAIASGISAEQALENLLRSQEITESELTTTILSERTLSLFGNGMEAGAFYVPKAQAKAIDAFDKETRDIRYLSFLHKDFQGIEEPNDEQLSELYNKIKESFASPERRDIVVATINTETLEETLTIEEDELRNLYEEDITIYTTPASRTITQAMFASEEDAQAALKGLASSSFVDDAKKAKADVIPAKAFSEDDILDELKEPVFKAEKTGIIGPIETPLGWNIVNLSKISEESIRPFEDVKKELREDMVQEQLIDEIYKLVDEVDEFFAVGGTIEDAQSEFDIKIQTFKGITRFGQNEKQESPLNPAFGPDAQNILQSAYELDEGSTGPAFELTDGKFIVVNNAAVTPKAYTPLSEVKESLKTQWINDQQELSNRTMLIELQKEKAFSPIDDVAKEKGKTFKTITAIRRADENSPLSPSARNSIFGAKKGEHFLIEIKNGVALAEVTKITKSDTSDPKKVEELQTQIQQDMQNELLSLYMRAQLEKHPAKINQRLLEQVYGEQSESY